MKKEAQVHMLPTEDISQVHYNKVRYPNEIKYELSFHKEPSKCKNDGLCSGNQYLYITTDEEIKDGDWMMFNSTSHPVKCIKVDNTTVYHSKGHYDKVGTLKVIATTDPKLTKPKEIQFGNMLMLDTNGDGSYYHYKGETEFSLSREELIQKGLIVPQPTQAFIEAYCKQGGIDEVDVEYDVITNTYDNIADLMCPHSVAEYEQTTSSISKLKVDPIYNTITTHLVEPEYYAVYDEVTNKTLHIQAPTLKDAEIIAAAIDFDNFVDGQNILTNPTVTLVEEKMYTLKDIKRAFYAGHQWATGDGKPIYSFKEWVEENL